MTLEEALKAILDVNPDATLTYLNAWNVSDLLVEVQTKGKASGLDWSLFEGDNFVPQEISGFGQVVSKSLASDSGSLKPIFVPTNTPMSKQIRQAKAQK